MLLVCAHFAWSQKQITPSSVQVYTTAKETNERLSASATALFAPAGQPFETQICIFVDPAKKFQTFMGIGGAITDASAEVFAALSPKKQQEFLDNRNKNWIPMIKSNMENKKCFIAVGAGHIAKSPPSVGLPTVMLV